MVNTVIIYFLMVLGAEMPCCAVQWKYNCSDSTSHCHHFSGIQSDCREGGSRTE